MSSPRHPLFGRPWIGSRGTAASPGRKSRRRPMQAAPPNACERLEERTLLAAVPPAPLVSLVQDTGISQTDRITSVGLLSVATAPGASAEYSTDGASWSATFTPQAGLNRVRVRQALPGSGPSAVTTFSFTHDTSAQPLTVSLKADTGAAGNDRVTKDGTLSFLDPVTKKSTVETGAAVQYWNGLKLGWESSFLPVEGLNTVKVRQVDRAGNTSAESTLEYTLDKTAPVAPAVSLATDTNISDDRITSDGTLLTATTGPNAVEVNATSQYSINGGKTWSNTFTPKSGTNAVLVRQVDLAGNASPATKFSFTYDNTAPARPVVSLLADTGASKTDRITSNGTLSYANPATKKISLEAGSALEFAALLPDGVTWSAWAPSFVPVEGVNSVKVRQTDKAGNVSPESQTLTFTLAKQPPTIVAVAAPEPKTYAAGQQLEFRVTYSRPVTVSPPAGGAVPYLDLTIGGSSRRATYAGGSGSATLVFRATVPAGSYGAVAAAGAIGLPPNAFIRDLAGNAGPATFGVPDMGGILVDAIVPVASLTFDPVKKSATIAFSRPVTGVDAEDFRIRGSVSGTNFNLPLTDPLVVNQVGDVSMSGSGALWTLTVESLPTAAGSFTLVLVAAGSGIVDALGNRLLADASVSVTR
jgi:hypothetical protein